MSQIFASIVDASASADYVSSGCFSEKVRIYTSVQPGAASYIFKALSDAFRT